MVAVDTTSTYVLVKCPRSLCAHRSLTLAVFFTPAWQGQTLDITASTPSHVMDTRLPSLFFIMSLPPTNVCVCNATSDLTNH